ncbi:sodium:calcium antiporter [Haladaptatus sp. CMAA 1911]|uniref:sodium:calcium antiporter n=1 Tax=unclassified Haladaptatus TaxID=2622732 RepID=UPI003753FD04
MHQKDAHATNPHTLLVVFQTLFALGLIIGGADMFVVHTEWVSKEILKIPVTIVALLIAPLATELPEKFNSIIWISRDKDILALGNITGAMAFQGTVPVTLGIIYTSWDISLQWGTKSFLYGFSALLALLSAGILYLRARTITDGNMNPYPFLIGGILYIVFIGVVIYHVLILHISGA